METIKNALGYGSQSGEEPASAETGKGTIEEPYDAGNAPGTPVNLILNVP